jgi:IS30 family transposase
VSGELRPVVQDELALRWSPQQIAGRLRTESATFECGQVSHQVDGSVTIQVAGRNLRLASHY